MPEEETILHYFDLYFVHVHPYVPVLNKAFFYQQWHQNRSSISPLLLEAIFAIGGRLAEDPGEGQQWLALASREPLLDHLALLNSWIADQISQDMPTPSWISRD